MDLSSLTPEQLANMPLQPNPLVQSNFVNPESNGAQAIILLSIFLTLATFMLALRMWSRLRIVKRTGLDDWTAVIALLFSASSCSLLFYLIHMKLFGPHSWDVRLVDFMRYHVSGILLAFQIIGNLGNFSIKTSILLFARRLFPVTISPKTAYAIWFGLSVNTIAYFIITLWTCIQCIPRPGSGGNTPPQCTSRLLTDLGIAGAALNAVLDLYVFSVCVPALWLLQMPTKRKISVVGILAIGLAACALSIITLHRRATNGFNDPTWKQTMQLALGALEPLLAIITACLPAMPALWTEVSTNGLSSLRRMMLKISSTTSFTTSSGNQRTGASDDEHSMKSLNTHNLTTTTTTDLERGEKTSFQIRATERQGF